MNIPSSISRFARHYLEHHDAQFVEKYTREPGKTKVDTEWGVKENLKVALLDVGAIVPFTCTALGATVGAKYGYNPSGKPIAPHDNLLAQRILGGSLCFGLGAVVGLAADAAALIGSPLLLGHAAKQLFDAAMYTLVE